jgi:hypothetical protein
MVKIRDFLEKELGISWTLLNIGWDGNVKFKKQLAGQDIVDFAITEMENGNESSDVVLLASSLAANEEEISELLKKLSDSENVNVDNEFRKWRVVYVAKNLPNNQTEYVQGLIELCDIWILFDFPDDSPHIFQGRNNFITPSEYYTQENYLELLEKHKKWIEKEISDLKSSD